MNVGIDLLNQSFPPNNQRPVRLAVSAPLSSNDVYIERSSPLPSRSIEQEGLVENVTPAFSDE